MKSAEELLSRAVAIGGRVVSSGDLNMYQISEAQARGDWWVSPAGFGWTILPWALTTDKDRKRESKFFAEAGER